MNKAFEIIFNDEHLIVVNKIAKLLIQPSPRREKVTLTSLLAETLGGQVFPCHRLDRETTGLIIYAKDRQMQRLMMDEFKQRQVGKKYLAFVSGKVKPRKGLLAGPIIDREGERFRERPKQARTAYRVLRELPGFSLVELKPLTGRTNQLRIQLAKLGNPILGEDKYAFRRDFKVKFKRLALHACYLNFRHPASGEKVELKIDLAEDMRKCLEKWR